MHENNPQNKQDKYWNMWSVINDIIVPTDDLNELYTLNKEKKLKNNKNWGWYYTDGTDDRRDCSFGVWVKEIDLGNMISPQYITISFHVCFAFLILLRVITTLVDIRVIF